VLAALLLGGCAVHRPYGPAVGEPARGEASQAGAGPVGDSGFAARIETQDPVLAAALRDVALRAGPAEHRRVAERYFQLRILDTAYDHFAKARDLDPADGAAYEGLARIWREWGLPDRGLADAFRAVYFAPSLPAAHNTLATMLLAVGRRADARPAFEQALILDPGASYLLSNLCYLSLLDGAIGRARDECRAAVAADPEFVPARNNLALVYAASQQEELAIQEFQAAGDAAAASYNLGMVLLAEGRYGAASRSFDAASRQRPSWSTARAHARRARALAAQAEVASR